MNASLAELVWRRAEHCCEYCKAPQEFETFSARFDHIIAQVYGGPTRASNLALSCLHCNKHKGPNLSGIDPVTKLHARLFHPRLHSWSFHFRWEGARLLGRTPIGRTTIRVLKINAPLREVFREELMAAGLLNSR